MSILSPETRETLLKVGTSTLTGALNRRGLQNMYLEGVMPLWADQPRMVGLAFTMRMIPARADMNPGAARSRVHVEAMETCPEGHVLVIDSRRDARAASAGDLYIGRLKARGCAGIVTDGGLRDSQALVRIGLPCFQQRPTSPPNSIIHYPCDLNLPIACGGVAVYPGDVIVGDCDGVVVIPAALADEIAREALATELYDAFAEEEIARGRALPGLFPTVDEQAKQDFEAWKAKPQG